MKEDNEKRCNEVVNTLDITRGRMTHGPNVKNALEHFLKKN